MAIDLKSLSKPKADRPLIITIFGEAGLGKTTLAAMFPSPVFIRTEDGTRSLEGNDEVALFPVAQTLQDVMDAIEALATQEHSYKTLVLDSVTQLADMIEKDIVDSDPKAKTIVEAAGGFGKGFIVASEKHRMVREWCGALATERGMNVIFIGHADIEKAPSPDMEEFQRYTVRMHKKSIPHYTDNVDVVAFVRLKTFTVTKGEKVQAKSDGRREIICFPVASNVSKNRLGISAPLPFDFETGNPFAPYLAR